MQVLSCKMRPIGTFSAFAFYFLLFMFIFVYFYKVAGSIEMASVTVLVSASILPYITVGINASFFN